MYIMGLKYLRVASISWVSSMDIWIRCMDVLIYEYMDKIYGYDQKLFPRCFFKENHFISDKVKFLVYK